MTVFAINVPATDMFVTFESRLDGTTFSFDLSWNQRAGNWFINVYLPRADGTRTPIVLGQCCIAARPLLAGITNDLRPLGELLIRGRDPGFQDWNSFSKLVYYDASEGFGVLTS